MSESVICPRFVARRSRGSGLNKSSEFANSLLLDPCWAMITTDRWVVINCDGCRYVDTWLRRPRATGQSAFQGYSSPCINYMYSYIYYIYMYICCSSTSHNPIHDVSVSTIMADGPSIDMKIWSNAFRLLSGPYKTFLGLDLSLSLHFFSHFLFICHSFLTLQPPIFPSLYSTPTPNQHLYCLLCR